MIRGHSQLQPNSIWASCCQNSCSGSIKSFVAVQNLGCHCTILGCCCKWTEVQCALQHLPEACSSQEIGDRGEDWRNFGVGRGKKGACQVREAVNPVSTSMHQDPIPSFWTCLYPFCYSDLFQLHSWCWSKDTSRALGGLGEVRKQYFPLAWTTGSQVLPGQQSSTLFLLHPNSPRSHH